MPLILIYYLFNFGAKDTIDPIPGIILNMHPYIPDLLGTPQSLAIFPLPECIPQVINKCIKD